MESTLPSLRRIQIQYTLIQMLYWAAYGAIAAFQTTLLLGRGFSSGDVGFFIALRCVAGIVVQWVGGWADRHPKAPLKYILTVCLLLALGVTAVLYTTRPGVLGTAVLLFLLGALELNAAPLLNSLAMQFINVGVDLNYSLSRGLGSLAYAVVCVFLGRISASAGVERVLPINMAGIAVLIVAILLFPVAPVLERTFGGERAQPHSVGYILKHNPPFTLMLVALFFVMAPLISVQNFMHNIVIDLGGNEAHLGVALFLMGAAELPSAAVFPKLWRKFGAQTLMVLTMLFMLLKVVGMSIPVLGVVLAVQLLQMLGYGLFLPTSLYYVNQNVPLVDQVRGQAIMMLASSSLCGVIGNLVSGFLIDLGGIRMLMAFCIGIGTVGMLVALLALRWAKKRGAF